MATASQTTQGVFGDLAQGMFWQGIEMLRDPMTLSSVLLITACALLVVFGDQRRRSRRRAERVARQTTERMAARLQRDSRDDRVVVMSGFQRRREKLEKPAAPHLQTIALAGRRRRSA